MTTKAQRRFCLALLDLADAQSKGVQEDIDAIAESVLEAEQKLFVNEEPPFSGERDTPPSSVITSSRGTYESASSAIWDILRFGE